MRGSKIAVTEADIAAAYKAADAETVEALKFARDRIRAHHQRQMPEDDRYIDAIGVELGSRWTAIEAVGLYVPGGTASYPSSVLMNAVPAQGCRRRAHRHGRAGARRRHQPAGAGRRRPRRRVGNLPRRRRAGGRRARLWHRDHPARRQDRRARATPMSPPPSARCSARSAST